MIYPVLKLIKITVSPLKILLNLFFLLVIIVFISGVFNLGSTKALTQKAEQIWQKVPTPNKNQLKAGVRNVKALTHSLTSSLKTLTHN